MARRKLSRVLDTEKLKGLMEDRGLSNKPLAEKTGLDPKTIDALVAGTSQPHSSTLKILADALRVPPSSLMRSTEATVEQTTADLPEALVRHVYSFDAFIQERTRHFVGRRFVFDRLDTFLKEAESGYFVIRGDPGIGKSALMAQLITMRKLKVYHFNIALQGINQPFKCLGNICARLISRFNLPHSALPDGYEQDGAVLEALLRESSPQLTAQDPLIIAIDALDEIARDSMPRYGNPLFLPQALPAHTYVVMTSRNRDGIAIQADSISELALDSVGELAELNREDVRDFISGHLSRDKIRNWIRDRSLSDAAFVQQLTDKSEGNFMYLHHVLPAIEAGRFTDSGVADLPHGLREYYRRHWIDMRAHDPEVFDRMYQPVVCILAAAYEPVPPTQVSEWTGLAASEVTRVIRDWAEFLHREPSTDGEPGYRLYHAAFRDYLQEEVDPGLRTYHRLIGKAAAKQIRDL